MRPLTALPVSPTESRGFIRFVFTWKIVFTNEATQRAGEDENDATRGTVIRVVAPLCETILVKRVKTSGRESGDL